MKKMNGTVVGKMKNFMKKETVLCIALLLAVISAFIVLPDKEYAGYIDFRVLALLFCLMSVVAGWQELGVFQNICELVTSKVHTMRGLLFSLIVLCFFSSMLITNDVALITFVPFTITLLKLVKGEKWMIPTIVLETISANLGSMLTPIGNPQNLYLYALSGMSAGEFIAYMLPVAGISFVLILGLLLLQKNKKLAVEKQKIYGEQKADVSEKGASDWKTDSISGGGLGKQRKMLLIIYCVLFCICIANVLHLIGYPIMLVVVLVTLILVNRKLLRKVDYSLLITFIGFFVFIGNMGRIERVQAFLQQVIGGRELLLGALTSQIISNVPAAMLLSGFTSNYKELIVGVNIGGLGTIIASMASLISYKYYAQCENAHRGSYMKTFLIYNFVLLGLLYGICSLII